MTIESTRQLHVSAIGRGELIATLRAHPELGHDMLRASYFCTPDWLGAVLEQTAQSDCLGVIAHDGSRPLAVLPLQRVRTRLGLTELRYLGNRYHPDPLGLICRWNDAPRGITAIRRFLLGRPGWHKLTLDFLPPEEAALWSQMHHSQAIAPYLRLPPCFDDLLATFTKKRRYKVRAALSAAAAAGATFEVAECRKVRQRLLDDLFALHDRRTRELDRASSIADPEVRSMHARLAAGSEAARLFALSIQGKPIAVLYGFVFQQRFAYYQVADDPKYSALSPGAVLLSCVIQWCCENSLEELDFLQGNEDYKFHWTKQSRTLMQASMGASSPLAQLSAQVESTLRSFKDRIRISRHVNPISASPLVLPTIHRAARP